MTDSEQRCSELEQRIRVDIEHFGQRLPERNAIAWRAYLAALLEWDVIGIAHYDALLALLPSVEDDPARAILLGRERVATVAS
jgi:hypothetical protein